MSPARADLSATSSPDTRRSTWVWTLMSTALVVAAWAVALVARRDFFYFDDTPGGAVGQWYELGQQLLGGTWPLLNLEAWMAGNYSLEQWGLFNPPTLLVALLATHATDLALFTAGVKLAFLLVGAWGVQYLCRTMGTSTPWAALAGASAAVAGFTFFIDATTWVTQLMVWAWFGWAMAALLRWVHDGTHLVLALVGGFLVITVGYVHGTLFLVAWFLALIVHALVDRSGVRLARTLASGVVLGLVAVAVYLPALLTSSVTVRADEISNDGFMTLTGNALGMIATPLVMPDVFGWWGRYAQIPLTYVAWFLPLVTLVGGAELARRTRPWLSIVVFGVLALTLAVGPSQLAMFRFPVRAMPWIALVLLVLAVRALDGLGPPRRVGAGAAIFLVGVGGWLGYAANPLHGRWILPLCLSLAAVMWVCARIASGRVPDALRRVPLVVVVGLVTVPIVLTQVWSVGHRDLRFGRTGFPEDAATLQTALPGGEGDAIVVGDPWLLPRGERWEETSSGNLWYLVDNADVMNLYSPSGFAAFNNDLCMAAYYGTTCAGLLGWLFTPDPTTGVPLVDLLSIDTIQVLAMPDQEPFEDLVVPDGWRAVEEGEQAVTWVRDRPTEGVAADHWASEGLAVSVLDDDDMHVHFRVDAVGPDGGMLVLPRLAWPGYTVEGAELADPLRGYLVTVDVPAGTQPGQEIEVVYRPPGLPIQLTSLGLAVLLGSGLVVGTWWGRRRRRPVASD